MSSTDTTNTPKQVCIVCKSETLDYHYYYGIITCSSCKEKDDKTEHRHQELRLARCPDCNNRSVETRMNSGIYVDHCLVCSYSTVRRR